VSVLNRALLRFFILLLIAGGLLFAIYDYQVQRDLADRLQAEQVEAGKRQVHQFSDEVKRTLERYQFRDLIDRTRGEFLQFEKLSQALMNSSEYISYVHWKNEKGETLLFRGPDSLQKFVINEQGVTYQQSTTSEVREVHVARPGRIDKITDITSPILAADKNPLGTVSLGIDQEKIKLRAKEAAERVRNRTILYSGVGILILSLVFWYTTRLVQRVGHLSTTLEHQSRMAYVGTLASGLVHEIRNPLNGINLNLTLLEDECREAGDPRTVASMERILGRIKPNLAHLENISTEFLMFAKPPKMELAETALDEVVGEVAELVRPECTQKNIAVDVKREDGLPRALLDRAKVRQILLNLAVNAIHAMPRGGTLTIGTRRVGEAVELTVADTGMGIAPENQKKLFSLFFSTKERGVGLGLPIVKRLAEDHGGGVTVESREGVGTTMRVTLPIKPAPEKLAAAGWAPDALEKGGA
jgi:signal transduction histidine kinase